MGNLLAALIPMNANQPANASRVSPSPDEGESTTTPPPQPSGALNDQQPHSPADGGQQPHASIEGGPQLPPPLPSLDTTDFLDQGRDPNPHLLPESGPAEIGHAFQDVGLDASAVANTSVDPNGSNILVPTRETAAERREIEAFAKIEFEDGNYYITTYACELGRDAFAYRAALARAEEAKQAEQERGHSSSGRRSGLSDGMARPVDSQVQGSVVSEAGGFGGVDEDPLRDGQEGREDGVADHSHSSQRSAGSVVKPQEVLINPPLIPFDYHKMAERQALLEREMEQQDDEQPAPVTADHIPDANNCPLIPIHAMRNFQKSEVENHKSISRRHVKIQWDFDKECFIMKVLGRNGAFLDDQYLPRGGVKRLRDGSRIQISNVWCTFRLPYHRAESASDDSERDDVGRTPAAQRSTSPMSNEPDRSRSPGKTGKVKTRITFTNGSKLAVAPPEPILGPDGLPLPPKKRGPGRPPKDGIMSTRERREREKAQRLAEAKAANGGKTPPPTARGKIPKPAVKEETPKSESKPEKRKYKKRKRAGEDGEVLPSIEGGSVDVGSDADKGPVKKSRASKSPSPEYPAVETLTEEQLARPSEPYARLIYDILIDIHPKALPLKQIYRALKLKFPFFVHRVDSEGWQSSVRHNLNQEWNKLFEKGEKEGKGFAWKAIPGALQPQAERRRAAQQAAAAKPKPPPAPRNQQPSQGPPPALNWQNSTPYPPANGIPPRGAPPPFFAQGIHGPPPPPNGMPWPPPPGGAGMSSASPAPNRPPPMPSGPEASPFYPHPSHHPPPFQAQSEQVSLSAAKAQPTPPAPQAAPHPPSTQQPHPATAIPPAAPTGAGLTSSVSASRNMPCTTDGLLAIRRFETAMYDQVGPQGNVEYWQQIFHSVKRRLLHGAPQSLMPGGETKEESTIMEHVRHFIERFKNPNFEGFPQAQTQSQTVSPASHDGQPDVSSDAKALTEPGTPQQPVQEEGKSEAQSSKDAEKAEANTSDAPANGVTD